MERQLPHDKDAPGLARAFVSAGVDDHLSSARRQDLVLMVSEIVSNAIEHAPPQASGSITLRLEFDDRAVRIVVIDGGSELAFDGPVPIRNGREGHYGLLIVDELSDRWGLCLDGGKAVWLEIDR